MMGWGFVPPGWMPNLPNIGDFRVPDKHPCTVKGEGPGRVRTRDIIPAQSYDSTTVVVEYDDAPGFWWKTDKSLVSWQDATPDAGP